MGVSGRRAAGVPRGTVSLGLRRILSEDDAAANGALRRAGYVAAQLRGGVNASATSAPAGPRNRKSWPPGFRNAWRLNSVRGSTRTARIVRRSIASCSSGRASSSSKRVVSTSARPRPSARIASRRKTAFRVLDSTSRRCRRGTASARGIAGDPPPEPMSITDTAVGAHVARRNQRLDQQPIDRLVLAGRVELERRQVHPRVPLREERVIPLEAVGELGREIDARLSRAAAQPIAKLPRAHPSGLRRGARAADRVLAKISAQNRDGGGRGARDAKRLAERFRPRLGKPLDQLARQARHAVEGHRGRNPGRLELPAPLDSLTLPHQIPLILHRRFGRHDVEVGVQRGDVQVRYLRCLSKVCSLTPAAEGRGRRAAGCRPRP